MLIYPNMYMLEICCVIICSEWRTVLNMNTHRHALIYVYISHFQKCTTACHIQWHNSFMNSIHIICFWRFFSLLFAQCRRHIHNLHIRCDFFSLCVWLQDVNDATHFQNVIMCKISRFYIQRGRIAWMFRRKKTCYT